jgi:hypothetical protein
MALAQQTVRPTGCSSVKADAVKTFAAQLFDHRTDSVGSVLKYCSAPNPGLKLTGQGVITGHAIGIFLAPLPGKPSPQPASRTSRPEPVICRT